MMKQEFEQMVGKEVSYETFEMYEKMYMALPESVNKQQFVEMLNLKAIPEDPAAVERREQRKAYIADINRQIEDIKIEIEWHKRWFNIAKESCEHWKGVDKELYESYQNEKRYHSEQIKMYKNRISELKMLAA